MFVAPISKQVTSDFKREIEANELEKQAKTNKKEPVVWDMPYTYNMGTGGKKSKKPGASVTPSQLRQFAEYYPVARSCINYLTSSITKLEWDIGSTDPDADVSRYQSQINNVKELFKSPSGHKTRLRELLSMIVEDVLVLDAVALYRRKTFGNDFLHLIPIDAGTIKLKVNDWGGIPEPPEIAYEQWVKGQKVAEMTTDDLIYEMLSPRTDNPYGRSALESLIVEVESALRGSLYNLKYLEEGNDPEGFGVLPEGWSLDQVQEFQTYWDGLMTGNLSRRRRLKFVPSGFEYIPSKKPEDMAFERFELWLMDKTCSVFGVPPHEIGFTQRVYKESAETQERLGKNRGLYPIANFIKEIFDDVIQQDMGYTDLAWLWTNIDPVDEENESKVFETLVSTGAKSVDEYRREKGLNEIGLGHYIMTPRGPILVEDVINGTSPLLNPQLMMGGDEQEQEQKEELERWQKCCIRDIRDGREAFRKFETTKIDRDIYKEIKGLLGGAKEIWQVKKIFNPYFSKEAKLVGKVVGLRNEIDDIISAKAQEAASEI